MRARDRELDADMKEWLNTEIVTRQKDWLTESSRGAWQSQVASFLFSKTSG